MDECADDGTHAVRVATIGKTD